MHPRNAVALVLAALPACDAYDAEPVELRDAHVGWNAANHAFAGGYADLAARMDVEEYAEIDIACRDGGSLHVGGWMTERRDFQLDAVFDECSDANAVVLDGNLTVSASLGLFFEDGAVDYDHDDIGALVIVDYHGMLHLDGEAIGACPIATKVHANGLVFAGFGSHGVVVEGELCGHDADAVVHAG